MNKPHQRAHLPLYSREQTIACIVAGQRTVTFGVSPQTVHKWRVRLRPDGGPALANRANAPIRVSGRLPDRLVAQVLRLTGTEIAHESVVGILREAHGQVER
ncbi:MAG: hypothetical protein Q4G22_02135 [Paracoccus sp. (in: a-proteobacteria)]|uniref:hypothetical protein n=1 Tax=Paracoccus sp. TaxID=267 RepID=UPI0026E0858F|nr:hypothetical protein [Paracoccus sp. (in: a-proteobacteria)]MDO5630616.1 hypothetical protein [Paracoccus sp. (in: a-proteobacteria)]